MEQHNDYGYAFGGGAVLTIISYLLKVDWILWMQQTGLEMFRAALVGSVGGCFGIIAKVCIEKAIKSRNKK